MSTRSKVMVTVGAALALAAWLAAATEPSDWRYLKLLVTQLPKMPFRYFV